LLWNPATKFTIILSLIRIVGFLKLIELIFRVVWTVKRNLRTTAALTERYGKGSWAVITGGSDGIGLAMAKKLASRHFNIVIISRNQNKMNDAAAEIKSVNTGVQVRTIEFDFIKTANAHSVADYQSGIIDKLADLDISILINNAGYMIPGDFDRISMEEHKNMIDVGIMPATMITKLLTDKMLARKKRTATMFVSSVQA
jgi:17beta-estradiol 17-dehydrogenase / very-long-chain 3-oxoacyl-CoA reductase